MFGGVIMAKVSVIKSQDMQKSEVMQVISNMLDESKANGWYGEIYIKQEAGKTIYIEHKPIIRKRIG
jgi:hypothetical protein